MKEYEYVRKPFAFDRKRYVVRGKTEDEAVQKKADLLAELKQAVDTEGDYTLPFILAKEPLYITVQRLFTYGFMNNPQALNCLIAPKIG